MSAKQGMPQIVLAFAYLRTSQASLWPVTRGESGALSSLDQKPALTGRV